MADDTVKGLARGLTNYGDKDFSLYLRRSFAKAMGFSNESLEKPIAVSYTHLTLPTILRV